MPIDQSVLRRKATTFQQTYYESIQKSISPTLKKSAFLCHSHKDEIIVKGLLELFKEAGINLYIDWKDHAMPDSPNVETAKRIQEKIRGSDLFLFLASANSKTSRWCPWEIGYGDSSKKKIYIIPTSDERDTYGNEYLELYSRIDIGSIGSIATLAVFEAGKNSGKLLSRYDL